MEDTLLATYLFLDIASIVLYKVYSHTVLYYLTVFSLLLIVLYRRVSWLLSLICYKKGLFTVFCMHFVLSDASDGPSESLDTVEKADDDDKKTVTTPDKATIMTISP